MNALGRGRIPPEKREDVSRQTRKRKALAVDVVDLSLRVLYMVKQRMFANISVSLVMC